MLGELFAEVVKEMRTTTYVIELVQFAVLVGIVWVVAVGFGKRSGFVKNMLAERHAKTLADLDAARVAPDALERERAYAAAHKKSARAEARHLLNNVKAEVAKVEAEEHERVDTDAAALLTRADETLATETEEMHAEVREQMVDLVTRATRRILNERMTLSDQRRLIEEHVSQAVEGMQSDRKPAGVR
ncbi:MAG TPA: ATP synthase F0 subunit B [Coriobacteriia bacterium]|nr:ATP synthase F0 subunit B [Coriobacteriia bacterium]